MKCFGEDLPQCCIQLYYILSYGDENSFVIYVSILLTVTSLVISFIAFLIATASILSNTDMKSLRESGVIDNYSAKLAFRRTQDETGGAIQETSIDNEKIKEEFKNRISAVKHMPRDTVYQKNVAERNFAALMIDLKKKLGNNDSSIIELSQIHESCERSSFASLDRELLDNQVSNIGPEEKNPFDRIKSQTPPNLTRDHDNPVNDDSFSKRIYSMETPKENKKSKFRFGNNKIASELPSLNFKKEDTFGHQEAPIPVNNTLGDDLDITTPTWFKQK